MKWKKYVTATIRIIILEFSLSRALLLFLYSLAIRLPFDFEYYQYSWFKQVLTGKKYCIMASKESEATRYLLMIYMYSS